MTSGITLYPYESPTRSTRDLSGVWDFRLDPQAKGEVDGWSAGFADARPIAVPCSWNELFDDARNYFGTAWYQTEFHLDPGWLGQRIWLRFGSANYRAKVWLNGQLLGEHSGGHLPFTFEISSTIRPSSLNRIVVLIENELREERVPAATRPTTGSSIGGFPAVSFDYFPYSGLHRPVLLFTTPRQHLHDITVRTSLAGGSGIVDVAFGVSDGWRGTAELEIAGASSVAVDVHEGHGVAQLHIDPVRAWCPDDPHLYKLVVRLGGADLMDEYHLPIGVRSIEVRGDQLLLNGTPIFLTGFGKHEDFPIHGRGLDLPVLIRDFELLKWIGANSFRTSHYPYSDEAMMLADRYGLLVIDETPAVSLGFNDTPELIDARREQLQQALGELITRDKNHPCVIIWSLANEPGVAQAAAGDRNDASAAIERGSRFLGEMFGHARRLDPTRPVVVVGYGHGPDEWLEQSDIVCVNLYHGWYYGGAGQLQEIAGPALDAEITRLRARHGKPIMLSEFGADTLAGFHAQPPEMWSEEYQAELMRLYLCILRQHPYVVGAHPWAFADFRTAQGITRAAGINNKGVFTRDRRPKLAAHTLRELWRGPEAK